MASVHGEGLLGHRGEVIFIIVGGIVCVTIHVLNHVNRYKYMDARAFMLYMLDLAIESPCILHPSTIHRKYWHLALFTESISTYHYLLMSMCFHNK